MMNFILIAFYTLGSLGFEPAACYWISKKGKLATNLGEYSLSVDVL